MAVPSLLSPASTGLVDPTTPPLPRRLEMGICTFCALMQCIVWLRSGDSLTALEHAQTALIVGYYGTWLALAALSPAAWWRRHRAVVAASRVLLGLLPSTRSLTVRKLAATLCLSEIPCVYAWQYPLLRCPAGHTAAPLLLGGSTLPRAASA